MFGTLALVLNVPTEFKMFAGPDDPRAATLPFTIKVRPPPPNTASFFSHCLPPPCPSFKRYGQLRARGGGGGGRAAGGGAGRGGPGHPSIPTPYSQGAASRVPPGA